MFSLCLSVHCREGGLCSGPFLKGDGTPVSAVSSFLREGVPLVRTSTWVPLSPAKTIAGVLSSIPAPNQDRGTPSPSQDHYRGTPLPSDMTRYGQDTPRAVRLLRSRRTFLLEISPTYFTFFRCPGGIELVLFLVYFPIGLILAILRLFIGFHAFLVACLLPKLSAIRR